jgi:hypothetical protein
MQLYSTYSLLKHAANYEEGLAMTQHEFLKGQVKWAEGILAAPAVTFPNGRNSHEVAREKLADYQDDLSDYELEHAALVIRADGSTALRVVAATSTA